MNTLLFCIGCIMGATLVAFVVVCLIFFVLVLAGVFDELKERLKD